MDSKFKYIIIALLIILILFFAYWYICYDYNNIKVDNNYFSVPKGYTATDNGTTIIITNGVNSIFLSNHAHNNMNVNSSISQYVQSKESEYNDSVDISSFDVNGGKLYKSTIQNDSVTYHYWFDDGNTVFLAYTWSGNSDTDSIVKELFNSRKTFIF